MSHMRRANAAYTTSTNSLNVLSTIFNGERRMTSARDWTQLHRWRCMYQNMVCLSNACFNSNGSCGGAGASNVDPASNCCGVCSNAGSNAGSNGSSNVFVITCCDEIWKVLSNLMAASNTSSNALSNFDSNCCVWTSNNFSNFLASNYKSNIDFASNTASWTSNALSNLDSNCCVWTSNNFSNFLASNYKSNIDFASNTASWTSNALSNFDSNCCVWTSNNFSNFLASNYQSNIDFASNTASWTSNALSNLDSNCCVWTSNNFSNFLASNYQSNIDFASNTAWWTSNALSNFDSNCCVWASNTATWASNLVFWASNNFSNVSGGSGGGTDECCAFTCNMAVWTSNALSNFSNSCDCSCPQYFSDVITIPAAGPVVVNHNLDLTNPRAFIITVFDEDTNAWLTPKISSLTANSLQLTGTTLSLNSRVNIQRNEPCNTAGNAKVCAYEYISVINSTQTLSDGTVATVSGSTGGTLKTFQGITGYNVGDIEDDEKITIAFSKTVTRIRLTLEAAERISGVYEQVKLFVNGAPYAVQASQMTTPITTGGKFGLIDGGFTLDPISVADDASALIIIEPPGGITSFSVQDIRVSGGPNGVVARIEALICNQ